MVEEKELDDNKILVAPPGITNNPEEIERLEKELMEELNKQDIYEKSGSIGGKSFIGNRSKVDANMLEALGISSKEDDN